MYSLYLEYLWYYMSTELFLIEDCHTYCVELAAWVLSFSNSWKMSYILPSIEIGCHFDYVCVVRRLVIMRLKCKQNLSGTEGKIWLVICQLFNSHCSALSINPDTIWNWGKWDEIFILTQFMKNYISFHKMYLVVFVSNWFNFFLIHIWILTTFIIASKVEVELLKIQFGYYKCIYETVKQFCYKKIPQ